MSFVCNGKAAQSSSKKELFNNNEQKLNQLSKKAATTSSNMNWLIYTLYARQEYQFCKQIIEQQLLVNSDTEYLYFIKGLIARWENNQYESLRCLQKSIELNPTNYENYKEIGKTLFNVGRWKQSLEVFFKAELLLSRPDPQVYHYIGELLYMNEGTMSVSSTSTIKNLAAAKEYFQRAIQNGKSIESYEKLALIYKEESNYPNAIEMLESTLHIVPNNVDILTEIGILYLKINDTHSAFDKLLHVTKLNEKCAKAVIALGAILQSINMLALITHLLQL